MNRCFVSNSTLFIFLFTLAANAVPWAPPSFGSSMVGERTGSCRSADGVKIDFYLEEHFHTYDVKTRNFQFDIKDGNKDNSFESSRGKFYQGGDQLAPAPYKKEYDATFILTGKGQVSLVLRMSKKGSAAKLTLKRGGTSVYSNKPMSCNVKVSYVR